MANLTEEFRTLINIRPALSPLVVNDFLDIPGAVAAGDLTYRITELPNNVVTAPSITDPIVVRQVDPTTHAHNAGAPDFHAVYTLVSSGSIVADEFLVDSTDTFTFGTIGLSQLNGGDTIEVIYTGLGSVVFAEDVNELADGTLIQNEKILPRHISASGTADFTFPNDVNVLGNLNVTGVVNKTASEILDLTDDVLFMNHEYSGAVGSAPTMGFELNRGNGQGDVTNPTLQWDNANAQWELTAETATSLAIVDTTLFTFGVPSKDFEVADGTAEDALAAVFAANATKFRGSKWFRVDTSQFKGWNGNIGTSGQDGIVILG